MNPIISSKNHSLTLSDGTSWSIAGKGRASEEIGEILAKTMLLDSSQLATSKLLIVDKIYKDKTNQKPIFSEKTLKSVIGNNKISCQVNPTGEHAAKIAQLLELSQIFCCKAEERGGLAIHSALAEKNGIGIILAGRGDVGKTTASKRLPSPWISLSDDCSLIVLDKQKKYRAHPWPTWSSLVDEKLPDKEKLALRTKRFENICRLVESIPVFLLDISLKGSFWKEIEKVLPKS